MVEQPTSGATIFAEGGPRMPPDMLTPLIMMIFGFTFFYGYALFIAAQTMVLRNERKSRWVKDIITNTKS